MWSLFKNSKVTVQAAKAADNESLTGALLDTTGYDSVAFIMVAGAGEAFATWGLKAQQGTLTSATDMADLAGTAVTFATLTGTNGIATLEIVKPREKYVRAIGTVPNVSTAKATTIIAIQFNAKDLPYSNTGELHNSPAEGTA